MKLLARGLFFGLFVGVIIGWLLAQKQQERKEKAAADAYANDPEVIALRKERERDRHVDAWINELEDENA